MPAGTEPHCSCMRCRAVQEAAAVDARPPVSVAAQLAAEEEEEEPKLKKVKKEKDKKSKKEKKKHKKEKRDKHDKAEDDKVFPSMPSSHPLG